MRLNKAIKYIILLALLNGLTGSHLLNAQKVKTKEDKNPIPDNFLAFGAQYGIQFPAGDLSDRFGSNFAATFSLDYYNQKLKGYFGLETQIQFGDNVKEDVLAPFRLSSGAILDTNGSIGQIFLRRRGFYLGAFINKTLVSGRKNPASGLTYGLGVGILEHSVRIQDDQENVGQVAGDLSKGYDRLTRGPAVKQAITYQHLGKNRNVNYSIGLTGFAAFTDSVRSINFDTGLSAKGSRVDLLISIDAKWYIPLLKSGSRTKEEVFY